MITIRNNRFSTALTKLTLFLFTFVFSSILMVSADEKSPKHKKIQHEVSVSRILLPIFAYDSKGEPVFDLKKEELRLIINNKKITIDDFNRIDFQHQKETQRTIKERVSRRSPVSQQRVIFIVIDTMFNSVYGIGRAKKIAHKFINEDKSGSQYVIMENSMFGGLKLLGGPEQNKKNLKKYLKKISRVPERIADDDDPYDISVRSPAAGRVGQDKLFRKLQRYADKEKVKMFCGFLGRLKYSLESISQPKLVLLISEGFPEILFFESNPNVQGHVAYDSSPTLHLRKLVKEINAGGSMLFAIYPGHSKRRFAKTGGGGGKGGMDTGEYGSTLDDVDIPIIRGSGIASLKALAVGTGGKLYDDVNERMVTEIQKQTAAYYEISFRPAKGAGDDMRIRVKCSRKGVTIDSLTGTKRNSSYREMNKIQKKVLALNLVMGKEYLVEKYERVKFQFTDKHKNTIRVNMPSHMNGRKVDIFTVRFQRDFRNPRILLQSRQVADVETITMKHSSNKENICFLIIEPVSNTCIYNRVF